VAVVPDLSKNGFGEDQGCANEGKIIMVRDLNFKKYEENGSYHWKKTYDLPFWKRSVRLLARYELVVKQIKNLVSVPASGLDIGCGDGVLVYRLSQLGYSVAGVDMSEEGILHARNKLKMKGWNPILENTSVYDLPFENESQDFITLVEVIEHLDNPVGALREISRVLKPGGIFICTTPQRRPGQPSDQVRDPYHVKEYIYTELLEELKTVFNDVRIYGAYQERLDNMYVSNRKGKIISRIVRLVFRLLAWIGINPYLQYSPTPKITDQLLIGVVVKSL